MGAVRGSPTSWLLVADAVVVVPVADATVDAVAYAAANAAVNAAVSAVVDAVVRTGRTSGCRASCTPDCSARRSSCRFAAGPRTCPVGLRTVAVAVVAVVAMVADARTGRTSGGRASRRPDWSARRSSCRFAAGSRTCPAGLRTGAAVAVAAAAAREDWARAGARAVAAVDAVANVVVRREVCWDCWTTLVNTQRST